MIQDPQTTEFDPYASASDPTVQTYDLFGQIEINAWAGALVKGQGRIPFDPTNPNHKRLTIIDVFVQPLAEIDIKYPKTLECHWVAEFPEWAKITLPSIKALGVDNVREINGKWARVARVPNGKQYEKKDAQGNPTGEMRDETTFKFISFFADEDACRSAYLAAGGQVGVNGNNGNNVPVTVEEGEKATALAFLKVIVQNAAKGKDLGDAQTATETAIAQYPTVAKFFGLQSEETQVLIAQFCNPPF
jgi:hypothetical protein